jgi:hypothetical protein
MNLRNVIIINRWEIINWNIEEIIKFNYNKVSASEIIESLDDLINDCEDYYGLQYVGHLKDRDEKHLYLIADYDKFIFSILKRHIEYNIPTEQELNESNITENFK